MDVYRGIIKDVFKHNPETIFFVTEVEALAHFLCIKKMNRLIPLHGPVHDAVVVMLDFGGHTMVSYPPPIILGSPTDTFLQEYLHAQDCA